MEKQKKDPILIIPEWPAPPQVKAFSTERDYGVSKNEFHSSNFSFQVGDNVDAVERNRNALTKVLGLTCQPYWLNQVHGTSVFNLDSYLYQQHENSVPTADGAVSTKLGKACVVMTADCLPVLFCDRSGSRVGVAHAGWRGLASGILSKVIMHMEVEPETLIAWLGPGIGQSAYEVGEEVRDVFLKSDSGAAACFQLNRFGRWQADLYGLARRSLRIAGLDAIYGGNFCTYTDSDRFFSHRRSSPCGRMATVIWLDSI